MHIDNVIFLSLSKFAYTKFYVGPGGDKSVVLEPMAEYARCFAESFRPEYCNMSLPASAGIERMNIIMFGLKTTTMIPYILYIAKNVPDINERNRVYAVLESYIMRRMVVHATTKNYTTCSHP